MDFYENCMAPYKGGEFLPQSLLHYVTAHWMPFGEYVHVYDNEHVVIKCSVRQLLDAPVKNWEHNRPPDLRRCFDIAKSIFLSKEPMDTMLFLAYNNVQETFDVLDGIHRLFALRIIEQENARPLDLLTPSEFQGDATWLFESKILLNIRYNKPKGQLIQLFEKLNRANPVPALYIANNTAEGKRMDIWKAVNTWMERYPGHFSPRAKPHKPNVNRDRFVDFLDNLYDKISDKDLLSRLDQTNSFIQRQLADPGVLRKMKLTESILEKCHASGCFLFLYSFEKLESMM